MKKTKILLLLLVCISLIAGICLFAGAEADDEIHFVTKEDGCYLIGDIDLDETVSTKDARFALRNAVGLDTFDEGQSQRADMNNDSKVGPDDARLILRIAIGLDPLPDHRPAVDAAVAATCLNSGLTEGTHCSVCGIVLTEQKVVPMLQHTFIKTDAVEPTCTEAGKTAGLSCSACGTVFLESKEIPAKGHVAVTDPAKAATCTEDGISEGSHCAVCSAVITAQETIPALGHDMVKTDAKPATCTDAGNVEYYTCSRCGKVFADENGETEIAAEIAAKGHTPEVIEGKPATCTETGLTDGIKCTVCGTVLIAQEEIPALGHDLVNHAAQAATCEEIGWDAYDTCTRCDYTTYKEIAATGHDYKLTETIDPTCTEVGYKLYVCANDDSHKTYEEIPAAGHTMTKTEAVAATCTEAGNVEYYTCSVCGKYFADENGETELTEEELAVPALGHDYEDVTEEATWVVNGKEYKKCTRCGDVQDEKATDTKLHVVMTAANDWAEDKNLDAFIVGSETNGADNTAVIELNVDGIWADPEIDATAFDGFMTKFGQAVTEYFGTDDVTINGNAVYKDGKFQNHEVKLALFDIGSGFFYKIANLGDDGVYGEYDVTIDDEAVALTVKFTGSEANLEKVKSFAGTIADHISADTSGDDLVIDVIAPDKLIATIAETYKGTRPVAEALKDVAIGNGLNILAGKDASSVFGSQVSAVNKLCAFLCKLSPLANKVIGKLDKATVTLANGEEADLIDAEFDPIEPSYADFLDAVIYMLDDELLARKVGEFAEAGGVYTIPVNVAVNMSNLGIMAGNTIEETVIIRLHLFDDCKHAEVITQAAKDATCTQTGLTEGSYCRICGKVLTAQETVPELGHDYQPAEDAATWVTNGKTYEKCTRCGDVQKETATDTKLHKAMETANAWATSMKLDGFISGTETNGADNTAEIALNVDGIWGELDVSGAFDGFMTTLGQTIKDTFGTDDVTIDGKAVYVNGKLQNTAVKNALFDIGAGFFYKIANLAEDGVYGTYTVKVKDEEIALTVKFTGTESNLEKVKSFAATIADHVSAAVVDGNLVIDVIAPDKLVSYIKAKAGDRDPVATLNSMKIGAGMSLLAGLAPEDVFGSQVSAVNKLCTFLCKLSPLANKVIAKITNATVTLASGEKVKLIDAEFDPVEPSYADFIDAVTYMLDDGLLDRTVGEFANAGGVYTIPVNVSVDMTNLGLMAGSVIEETVIINLHIFDR